MFVRLTRKDDGGAVYFNAAQVRGVYEERDVTWVYVGKMAYMVEESAKAVVTLLEAEMRGGVEVSAYDELVKERKGEAMERAAVELFMYYRALVNAGFTKKQAMKVVMAAVNRSGRR
jgi:hypothetical protein